MVGGRLRYSICFFTCSALLLLGLSLHDVEASSCQRVIHKKVGDTVELSSCLPTEGVTLAIWKYGQLIISDKDEDITEKQFKGRLDLNPTNFDLTVRGLTLKDSGDFSFVSEVNNKQRGTVTIELQVYEPITTKPVLNGNSTWHTSNESCTVLLECSATSDSSVTYNWTVRNQTRSGPRLQYILKAQDGDTTFTCTVYNLFSQMSESRTVKCSSNTQEITSSSSSIVPLIIRPVIGILLIILLLLLLLFYTKSKDPCCNRLGHSSLRLNSSNILLNQSQTGSQDETQQQVYSSLLHGDGSVYETMRTSEDAGTGGTPNQCSNVASP